MAKEVKEVELLDEIELAKYRRMANDAISGHFPQHIYGDQSHIEVLAAALERCVDNLEDAGEGLVDKLDAAEEKIVALEEQVSTMHKLAEGAYKELQKLFEVAA